MDRDLALALVDLMDDIKTVLGAIQTATETIATNTTPSDDTTPADDTEPAGT